MKDTFTALKLRYAGAAAAWLLMSAAVCFAEAPTVAVLPFVAADPSNEQLGEEVAAAVMALMAGEEGFELVDREQLMRVLDEQALGPAGLADADKAAEVGRLVGAKLLVTGRLFPLGQSMMLTAKVISVETSRVDAVVVRGKPSDIAQMTVDASSKLAAKIRSESDRLTGVNEKDVDPLPGLIKKLLSAGDKPAIAVVVLEDHLVNAGVEQRGDRNDLDPVVETELKKHLIAAGFEVFDVEQNQLADWADFEKTNVNSWPRGLARADLLIVGEAYSEEGLRVGRLVSASARGEINAIERETGRVVIADHRTARGVGVSPRQAGEEALQKIGVGLSVQVLRYFTNALDEPGNNPDGDVEAPGEDAGEEAEADDAGSGNTEGEPRP